MRNKLIFASAIVAAVVVGSQSAQAGSYAAAELNVRAGPSTRFPSLGVLPEGAPIHVFGCTRGYRWCDVQAGGRRGWVSAAYIEMDYEARRVRVPVYVHQVSEPVVPTVSFSVESYWPSHYSGYDFYDERDTWDDVDWESDGPPPGWDPDW